MVITNCPLLKLPISDLRCEQKVREELKTWRCEEIAHRANGCCPCELRNMNLDELLKRLANARDLNVPECECENLCSVAYEIIIKLRDGLVRLRKIIGA